MTTHCESAVYTKAMSDSAAGKTEVKKSVEKAVAGASHEARVAKITKSAAEQTTAAKADAVSSVAETVLNHETVQEVTVDRDCRSRGALD